MPAGRPLEPAGDGRPRWMTVGRDAARHPVHRIRLTGQLVRPTLRHQRQREDAARLARRNALGISPGFLNAPRRPTAQRRPRRRSCPTFPRGCELGGASAPLADPRCQIEVRVQGMWSSLACHPSGWQPPPAYREESQLPALVSSGVRSGCRLGACVSRSWGAGTGRYGLSSGTNGYQLTGQLNRSSSRRRPIQQSVTAQSFRINPIQVRSAQVNQYQSDSSS